MKKLFSGISLFLISFLFIVTASDVIAEENLLINPGFEEGAASWNLWGKELPQVAERGRTGKGSLKVQDVQGGYTAGGWESFNVEQGKAYTFEAWVKTASLNGEAWIELQWFDGTNTVQIDDTITSKGSAIISKTVDWTKLQVEAYAPPGAKIGRIACKVEGTGGLAYFDDAKVVKQQPK